MSDTPIVDAMIKKHSLCCNLCPQMVYEIECLEREMKGAKEELNAIRDRYLDFKNKVWMRHGSSGDVR